ncbi:hypothetical protein DPMN_019266 [Dreissena polymorpha]|uniref:Uncharacterized protein n=1 Tax=Dreissena polymorpha TaxID=45954 RepID=A0A9D4NIY0_DREPO|nr:hypothetical protein DPMN_019266 [Dreissena polymorpha]
MPISIENSPFWCGITIFYITQASSNITIYFVTQASSDMAIYFVTQAMTVQQKWNSSQTLDTILAHSLSSKNRIKPDTGHLEVNSRITSQVVSVACSPIN